MKKCFYEVYRCADTRLGEHSLHGLSSRVVSGYMFFDCTRDEAIEYCLNNKIEPSEQFFLHKRELWGEDHSFAEPLIKPTDKMQCFGGNFIFTSNGNGYRYEGEKCNRPIPVHDRFEKWNSYD